MLDRMATFPYYAFDVIFSPSSTRKKTVWRPVIEIILIGKKNYISHPVLIDSGSDCNIFDAEVADVLELTLKKGKMRKIYGFGSQAIKTYEHRIEIRIPGLETYTTKALFTKLPGHTLGVLGNVGFFDKFEITFDYENKNIDIN